MQPTDTLRAQIGLAGIMIFAAFLLCLALPREQRRFPFAGVLLAHVFITGVLLSVPMPEQFKYLNSTQMFLWVDLVAVALLVLLSGGSSASCFGPLYFALPTLALLLRQDWNFIFYYGAAITLLFWLTLAWYSPEFRSDNDEIIRKRGYLDTELGKAMGPALNRAYGIISALCFALTIYIGYITSPHVP